MHSLLRVHVPLGAGVEHAAITSAKTKTARRWFIARSYYAARRARGALRSRGHVFGARVAAAQTGAFVWPEAEVAITPGFGIFGGVAFPTAGSSYVAYPILTGGVRGSFGQGTEGIPTRPRNRR